MKLMKFIMRVCFYCIMFFCFMMSISAQGQDKTQSENNSTQALLNEVRLLRQTLQQVNLFTYRGQMLVERIRLGQDRVARLNESLDKLQGELRVVALEQPGLELRVQELQTLLERTQDPKQRVELENEIKVLRNALPINQQRAEELRKREFQVAAAVREEQSKLQELEDKLERLEAELEVKLKAPNSHIGQSNR